MVRTTLQGAYTVIRPEFIDHLFHVNEVHKTTSRNELIHQLAILTFDRDEEPQPSTLDDIRQRIAQKERFNEAAADSDIMETLRSELDNMDPNRE